MRLLHTIHRELEDIPEHLLKDNPYCILSHVWNKPQDEIVFRDIEPDRRHKNWKKHTSGYRKLNGACKLAAKLGYDWIWIDTCCIDKGSSAELSESLNSMFRWYKDAKMCIAYLADVQPTKPFDNSEWWKRGWTLQELIAPNDLRFYDCDFNEIGTKRELHKQAFKKASIAARFSWASKRETSRKEDEAYCLLGLMQVNMTSNYGERENAFLRLQKEIMANSDDETLFAWIYAKADKNKPFGLLAPSPSCFEFSAKVRCVKLSPKTRSPYRWTQKGVEIKRRHGRELWEIQSQPAGNSRLAIGATRPDANGVQRPLFIYLCRIVGQFYRTDANLFYVMEDRGADDVARLVEGEPIGWEQTFYVAQPTVDVSSDTIASAQQKHTDKEKLQNMLALGFGGATGFICVRHGEKMIQAAREAVGLITRGYTSNDDQHSDPGYKTVLRG